MFRCCDGPRVYEDTEMITLDMVSYGDGHHHVRGDKRVDEPIWRHRTNRAKPLYPECEAIDLEKIAAQNATMPSTSVPLKSPRRSSLRQTQTRKDESRVRFSLSDTRTSICEPSLSGAWQLYTAEGIHRATFHASVNRDARTIRFDHIMDSLNIDLLESDGYEIDGVIGTLNTSISPPVILFTNGKKWRREDRKKAILPTTWASNSDQEFIVDFEYKPLGLRLTAATLEGKGARIVNVLGAEAKKHKVMRGWSLLKIGNSHVDEMDYASLTSYILQSTQSLTPADTF